VRSKVKKMKSYVFMTILLLFSLTPYSLPLTPVVLRAQSLSEINTQWLERQEKALQWGRDPFALPSQSAGTGIATDGEFHLSAIIYRTGRGVAIINNKILRQGDMIEGRRIAQILEDRVVLQGAAGEKELRVNKFVLGR
jgi:hypothetical protein